MNYIWSYLQLWYPLNLVFAIYMHFSNFIHNFMFFNVYHYQWFVWPFRLIYQKDLRLKIWFINKVLIKKWQKFNVKTGIIRVSRDMSPNKFQKCASPYCPPVDTWLPTIHVQLSFHIEFQQNTWLYELQSLSFNYFNMYLNLLSIIWIT